MKNIYLVAALVVSVFLWSCGEDKKENSTPKEEVKIKKTPPQIQEYGFLLNDYEVVRDTIRLGDSFGGIMDANGVTRGEVFRISEKVKDTFNPARIVAGKPYTILKSKDTSATVKAFIYENDRINYTVVDLADSIRAYRAKKPVTIKRKVASGVITSSLSGAMDNEGLSILLADKIADIYRWKIDFFKIQKGDQFKLIYNEKYINDTVYAGVENIEAAVLTHYKNP